MFVLNTDNIVYQIAYTLRDDLSGGQEIVLTHDHNDLPFSVIIPTVGRNAEYLIRLRAGNTALGEWSDYVSMSVMTLIDGKKLNPFFLFTQNNIM